MPAALPGPGGGGWGLAAPLSPVPLPGLQVFRFDPRHAAWLQVASMLERRTRFHAGPLSDRLVAVAGGALLGALTSTAEEYRLAENEWRPLTPFPTPVADHAGATHKGILYVSGERRRGWEGALWGGQRVVQPRMCRGRVPPSSVPFPHRGLRGGQDPARHVQLPLPPAPLDREPADVLRPL